MKKLTIEPIDIPTPENISPTISSTENNKSNDIYLLSLFCIINKEFIPIKIFPSLTDMSEYLFKHYNLKYNATKLNYLVNDRIVRVHIVLSL